MRLGAIIVLVAVTALVSYSLGRRDVPTRTIASSESTTPSLNKPVAVAAVPEQISPRTQDKPEPAARADQQPTKTVPPTPPVRYEAKRNVETALTAAAIVAILIKASRDQYHATGHPCACPDDLMRNGRACGARSAYSRPGGAAPKCYPNDITESMISSYRQAAAR
jgi:hypothetical protein